MKSGKEIGGLAKLVLHAYVNEVCLDRSMKAKFLALDPMADALPQYKIMPLLSLCKRYGKPMLWLLSVLKFVILPVLVVAALVNLVMAFASVLPFWRRQVKDLPPLVCLPNTAHLKLFHYLFDDFDTRVKFECRRPWAMLRYLDARDYLRALLTVWRVIWYILLYQRHHGVRRQDLIFHAVDVLPFVCYSLFLIKLSEAGRQVVTDCNLQRWDYVATHLMADCSIIQHAYIHPDLDFSHTFGPVDCLFVFDQEFETVFSRYYQFKRTDIIRPKLTLADMGSDKQVLFLASSAPFLNTEIDFLERVKQKFDFFIVVKLHPRHVYDESVTRLVSLADCVAEPAVFPDCHLQVSYDSFLGYEYKALGKKVLFLKDECSVRRFMERP
ncbi:hypothetical protein SAMN04490182_0864 [Pseudomonas cedrina]|uniref:Uncharacterized protein n=2 Tax=Pseudomonas cedrina TaxID=651740 RepID=A0A1V2KG82_PSECE|nr:hypothetical protein [Pseudomonas cedrina]ONH56713.1 hypothetical protein BLL36_04875 [Pseudomonas cedrina subsp. cedrina]SDS15568.1 hypothetical protein SAMN04490182_0864 [Pseudomonas cedrina]